MPASRRGSGSVTLLTGQTIAIHTRTQDEEDLPHATKKTMADHLRKYESLFTLTPQRMRMIVEAFTETLELGLNKPNQIVVRMYSIFRNRIRSPCICRSTQLTLAVGLEMRRFYRSDLHIRSMNRFRSCTELVLVAYDPDLRVWMANW